jgi:hypothetical protein
MNKKFLFIGIFYVIFSVLFFSLTFGRADDACYQLKDISPANLNVQASHIFEMGAGFVCALKYIFLAISIITLFVGVFSIARSFKKKVEIKK